MRLTRFMVEGFRSVADSGWIDCDNTTTLVGINESGKSNLLLALWKLKPAGTGGDIDPLHDMPASKYSEWRNEPEKHTFIRAEFEIDEGTKNRLKNFVGTGIEKCKTIEISRKYDGEYNIKITDSPDAPTVKPENVTKMLSDSLMTLEQQIPDVNYHVTVRNGITQIQEQMGKTALNKTDYETISSSISSLNNNAIVKPFIETICQKLDVMFKDVLGWGTLSSHVIAELPSFIYYSNYGNLDSKIYLPHAIEKIGGKYYEKNDESKARTLEVLFKYVGLNAEEILELGKENQKWDTNQRKFIPLTSEEILKSTENREERTILLNSASSKLTREFKNWWKQGEYIFRFSADGDYFYIYVSDEKRPDEIDLGDRSTGLQWFISFYLVFLVESQGTHKGTILLLDEAGMTLHPLAQKDLLNFFNGLSETNQIIHTTHSPFLVDMTNVDRVKAVYVDKGGYSIASDDLRASGDKETSVYAVHAAMGLSVSDILLQGCNFIIVEGVSDQYYLNAIKSYLMKKGKYSPSGEMTFIPAGGVKGVNGLLRIMNVKNDELPIVFLDSDTAGNEFTASLRSGPYKNMTDRIIQTGDLTSLNDSELEDLIPLQLMLPYLEKAVENENHPIQNVLDDTKPLIPQIERYAEDNDVTLDEGWKVKMAKDVKRRMEIQAISISDDVEKIWIELFENLGGRRCQM